MDIHLIMLVFICYINGKICIDRVFLICMEWNRYTYGEGNYDCFSNSTGCCLNHIARFIWQHKIISEIFFVLV